jgi:phosphoserine phosphatase
MTSLTSAQTEFIDGVLSLKPRVATFDCDGTLWSGDAGEGFFSWEMDQGLVSKEIVSKEVASRMRARYAEYRAGLVAEDVMCGEMVTMHRGLQEDVVQQACDTYFAQAIAPNIFPEIRDLDERLRSAACGSSCDVWAVSSSSQWIIRSAMRYFGIPRDRILATEVAVENGVITDQLIRVPSGPGKVQAIRSVLSSAPDCAFGNAIWDREMLALSRHAFAINPNPNLKEIALASGWTVYQPDVNHAGE